MSDSKNTEFSVRGLSTLSLFGVLFVGLKLTGHVDWSWFWVTMPFWGGLAIVLGFCAVLLIAAGAAFAVAGVVDGVRSVRKQKRDGIR